MRTQNGLHFSLTKQMLFAEFSFYVRNKKNHFANGYEKISGGLYKEFMHFGVVKNESDWIQLQVKFLENHSIHTDWAKLNRDPQKVQLLQRVHDNAEALGLSKKAS